MWLKLWLDCNMPLGFRQLEPVQYLTALEGRVFTRATQVVPSRFLDELTNWPDKCFQEFGEKRSFQPIFFGEVCGLFFQN